MSNYRLIENTVNLCISQGMYNTALNTINQAYSRKEITQAEYDTLRGIINRAQKRAKK